MCCFVSVTQRTRHTGEKPGAQHRSSLQLTATARRTDEIFKGEMSMLGKVRIGHKAPDFHCEAVIAGAIEGWSLPYPSPSSTPPDMSRRIPQHLHPRERQAQRAQSRLALAHPALHPGGLQLRLSD
jgi:hypothetical protein